MKWIAVLLVIGGCAATRPFGAGGPKRTLAASANETCAIRSGEVWCWGNGKAPRRIPGLTSAVEVSMGGDRCALRSDGRVECWE
jgi:hypothetical protein